MSIFRNIKRELFIKPLASAIGIIVVLIMLYESSFDKGNFFNYEKPQLVIGGQFSLPNNKNSFGKGDYVTHVLFENTGVADINVFAHVYLLSEDRQLIKVLNDDGQDTATKFSLLPGAHKEIVATSNLRPVHLVLCSKALTVSSSEARVFNTAYSLMAQTPDPKSFLKYQNSNVSGLERYLESCPAKLQISS